ncbi:JNK-interacting protein 3 isoform X5 [Hermetia illucens]|uniref:JNK-interacting protein 3 isoform X5 n=1 Tax=Hermetia illucens TaxID=343691 RepID=UPI0018CC4151|nr:JNK-interacting protein 3 isoform X5 [Hermetia illucens]
MDSEGLGRRGPDSGAETVYGTHEDNTMVMSEKTKPRLPRKLPIPDKYEWKCTSEVSLFLLVSSNTRQVQSLAASIYQEFERMIQRYDEDVVKTLMPLLVNVLECLDAAYRANQEQDVEVELLREDNEQLVTQYEREKSARKLAEQKLLETEDVAEAENKELASRLESLESIVRMLELKHKNSLEHASRLEEREGELKKEYNKLHERYTELFKTHVDYMERTKMLMGSTHSQMSSASERLEVNRARLNPIVRSSGPVSYGFASLENSAMLDTETICSVGSGSDDSGPPSLQNELDNVQTMERAAETDTLHHINQATSPQSETSPVVPNPPMVGRTTTKKEQRSGNTLYQELSFQDNEESEEHEVTGSWVHPGEYASSANDNYFGMGKEVENLIMENNELLATKNALNIVKDDLIVKVDELTGEIEILREELNAMSQSRNKLRQKVSELEEELKKTKEQVKQQNDSEQENESDIPMAQRKRFTRVEMAMVLMERNQYKERLMELQEAVRLTEILRATRTVELGKNSKQGMGIWKYFSKLFSSSNPQRDPSNATLRYTGAGNYHGSPVHSEGRASIASGNSTGTSNALVLAKDYGDESTSERVNARRREQLRQLRAHVQKEDGRLHAYGWSLPVTKASQENHQKHAGGVPVPVPVFCNPLAEGSPHMKVFCAAGVNLQGGYTKDGECIFGSNMFYSKPTAKITEIISPTGEQPESDNLDRQIVMPLDSPDPESELSSLVWICRSAHAASTVTVVDANEAATILDAFPVCETYLLCVASVIGALEKDYALLENSEVIKAGEMLEKPGEGPDDFGKVEYVRLSSGKDVKKGDLNENTETKENGGLDAQADDTPNGVQIAEETNANENGEVPATAEEVKVASNSPTRSSPQGNRNANNNTSQHLEYTRSVNPIMGTRNRVNEPLMTSVGPTMWLGAQSGMLYVHSAVSRWHECLHKVHLPEPVLSIVHVESRVVVALANAKLAVFRRQTDGQWDLNNYHLVTLGEPKHAIRCLCVVGDKIWAAYRNKIFVVDPISLNIVHTLEAHPRKESQVKQMVTTGVGVWVSIRLDSTLRLYHANTYEHIQDVDIEPYVSKMLGTGKLGFSFVRITALMVSCNRLWIGTGNGVIISVPLTDASGGAVNPNTFIPRCCMANAQLSFHGHRDVVKFFVSVPMSQPGHHPLQIQVHNNKKRDMLVMCGGEGYIDFRLEEHADDACDDATHLIVWRNYHAGQ